MGFTVLMPVLGVQKGPWAWQGREYLLTVSAHLSCGVATAATLRLER